MTGEDSAEAVVLVAALKKEVAHCTQTNPNLNPRPTPTTLTLTTLTPALATLTQTPALATLTLALALTPPPAPAQVADYIESMFESKKEGMVVTLAPLTAITETCASPDLTTPTPRPLTAITETYAAYGLPLTLALALLP